MLASFSVAQLGGDLWPFRGSRSTRRRVCAHAPSAGTGASNPSNCASEATGRSSRPNCGSCNHVPGDIACQSWFSGADSGHRFSRCEFGLPCHDRLPIFEFHRKASKKHAGCERAHGFAGESVVEDKPNGIAPCAGGGQCRPYHCPAITVHSAEHSQAPARLAPQPPPSRRSPPALGTQPSLLAGRRSGRR